MAVGEYRGVSNVARKITQKYRGVSNVARKVTNRYRGVANVARRCFVSGSRYKFSYWTSDLSNTPHVEGQTYKYGIESGGLHMYIKSVGVGYVDNVRPHIWVGISDGTDMSGRVLTFTYRRNTFMGASGYKDDFCIEFCDANGQWIEHDTSYGGAYSVSTFAMLNNTTDTQVSITMPQGTRMISFDASFGSSNNYYVDAWVSSLSINGEVVI